MAKMYYCPTTDIAGNDNWRVSRWRTPATYVVAQRTMLHQGGQTLAATATMTGGNLQ